MADATAQADPATPPDEPAARAFTVRSLVAGSLGALIVVVLAWFNDQVLRQTPAIGHFMPALPFGLVLLLAFVWNPLLGRWRALAFSPRELAVVLGLCLMVSWIPVSGLMRYFQRSVVSAQVRAPSMPEWRRLDILGHLPPEVFPLRGSAEALALSQAIADERAALAGGAVAGELTTAGIAAETYAAALDLAALVPPRQWRDNDRELVRTNTERALQRVQADDPLRWAPVTALLGAMPTALERAASAPEPWRTAQRRVEAAYAVHLPAAQQRFEKVFAGMTLGLPVGDERIALSAVPWAEWLPALVYWAPLILLLALAILMLTVIVHRQWSRHEQLTFPIAGVCTAMLQRSPGTLVADIVRSRLFWFGVLPVAGIHLLNYLALWFPGSLPSITLRWWQGGMISDLFPATASSGGAGGLAFGDIYFAVIGLAFFISSEVSFSLGISGILVLLLSLQVYAASGTTIDMPSARSGAYVAYFLVLLWTGRIYYWAVLRGALGLKARGEDPGAGQVWAARIFLAAFAAFVAVLVGAFGLDWLIALAYALTVMILFLVITRIVCETGVPFVQAGWHPAQLIGSLFGVSAVGAAPLVLIHYLGCVLSEDPREALMPYAANAMEVAERTGASRLRLALVGFAVIVVAGIIAFIATTWGMYNYGAAVDGWGQQVAQRRLGDATRGVATLVETGQYAATSAAEGLSKLAFLTDNVGKGRELGWIVFGAGAVVAVSLLRFRWAGFYLHPVLFLFWDTWSAQRLWLSFLIGWLIKELVVRIGGGRTYQQLKPLFIGLIIGEVLAAVATLATGWIYYLATGLMPVSMAVFAG